MSLKDAHFVRDWGRMHKESLQQSIQHVLQEEFDQIIMNEFCAKPGLGIKALETTNKYNIGYNPKETWRRIKVDVEQSVTFSKAVSPGSSESPASITVSGPFSPSRGQKWYSFTDLCAIFFPDDRVEVTKDWRQTLKANIQALSTELPALYEKDVAVTISNQDPRDPSPDFWLKPGLSFRQQFYAGAYPILKAVVEKGVPDITLVARFGSDSPYQRYRDAEIWSLLSFRLNKRQQVDIVQYLEARKIRYKFALIDLGFLENGYGKVAKIKELISMDVDAAGFETRSRVQKEFLSRVLKETPGLFKIS